MKIVVIGGTGRIGSALVKSLQARGHDASPAAPETGVNTLTGEGLAEALAGAEVVIDVANSPSWDDEPVMHFFKTTGHNLLAAEKVAGVRHHVALSIVGADRLPTSGYLRAKVVQEALIEASGVDHTIVRSTQFLPFIEGVVNAGLVGNQVHAPTGLMQPIHPNEVVGFLADFAIGAPANGRVEIGGPEPIAINRFAEEYLSAKGDPRPVIGDPMTPYFGAVLDERSLIPSPGARLGAITVAQWLSELIPAD